jgi:hypothetical protein
MQFSEAKQERKLDMYIQQQNIFRLSPEFTKALVAECETHRFYYSVGADSIFDFVKLYCAM